MCSQLVLCSARIYQWLLFRFKFQLSSKCDNRLFRIRFHIKKSGSYPFFEAFSNQIRCISRGRNIRASSLTWKRSTSAMHPLNLSQSSRMNERSLELQYNSAHEVRPCPPSKRVRSGQDKVSEASMTDPNLEQHDEKCNSPAWTAHKVLPFFL